MHKLCSIKEAPNVRVHQNHPVQIFNFAGVSSFSILEISLGQLLHVLLLLAAYMSSLFDCYGIFKGYTAFVPLSEKWRMMSDSPLQDHRRLPPPLPIR